MLYAGTSCRRLGVVLALWASMGLGIAASLPSGGASDGSDSGGRPGSGDSAIKGIAEIIESAGELLLELVRPAEEQPSLENPKWDSQATPRGTVMTFVELMQHVRMGREEAWSRVAPLLGATNQNDLPAEWRSAAIALREVFDRIGPMRPYELPGDRQMQEQPMTRYEVFPYGLQHAWVWEQLGEAPEGSIEVVWNPNLARWEFSRETVAGAEALYESMRKIPPRYERQQMGRTFLDVFGPTFRRTPWWGWLALFGFIVLGVFGGRFARRAVNAIAKKLERGQWEMAGAVIRTVAAPLSLVLFTIALTFGLIFIRFAPTLSVLRWDIIKLLLLASLGWLLFEVIDLVTLALRKMFRRKTEYTDMAVTLVRRSLRVFITVIFVIFVLQNVLGLNITALITGLGIVGLAISLAGKDSARNLFGALTVFMNRPFVVNDFINFRQNLGQVEDVGMQTTRVRLVSGELLVVPNMQFIDHEVENLSLRQFLRREMEIALTYGSTPEQIEKALQLLREVLQDEEVVSEGEFDMEARPPRIAFEDFGDYSLKLKVFYWYYIHENHHTPQRRSQRGYFSFLEHCTLVNRKIHQAFGRAGIRFAFPTQTLHVFGENGGDGSAEESQDNPEGRAARRGGRGASSRSWRGSQKKPAS